MASPASSKIDTPAHSCTESSAFEDDFSLLPRACPAPSQPTTTPPSDLDVRELIQGLLAINVPRNDNDKQEEKEAVIRGLTQQASEIELHNIGSAAAPTTAYTNQEGVGMFAQLREVGEENARLETRLTAVEKLCGEFRNEIDALAPVRNLAVAIRKRAYVQYEKVDAKSEELIRDSGTRKQRSVKEMPQRTTAISSLTVRSWSRIRVCFLEKLYRVAQPAFILFSTFLDLRPVSDASD
jgi:hypothetical protein